MHRFNDLVRRSRLLIEDADIELTGVPQIFRTDQKKPVQAFGFHYDPTKPDDEKTKFYNDLNNFYRNNFGYIIAFSSTDQDFMLIKNGISAMLRSIKSIGNN